MNMDIRPLHTERDYREALEEVFALIDLDPHRGTPEGDRLEILATLVEHYEAEHFPLEPTQQTLALLRILAAGTRQIAEGRTKPIDEVVTRLKARNGPRGRR